MVHVDRDATEFVALVVWPVIFGVCLIVFGLSRPSSLFGLGLPRGWVYIVAGFAQIVPVVSQRTWVRASALGVATFVLLGRAVTLMIIGESDLSRTRELGATAIWWGWWASVVLVHFLSTPDAVRSHYRGRSSTS